VQTVYVDSGRDSLATRTRELQAIEHTFMIRFIPLLLAMLLASPQGLGEVANTTSYSFTYYDSIFRVTRSGLNQTKVDMIGPGQFRGRVFDALAAADDPANDPNVWTAAETRSGFGVLRASAFARFDPNAGVVGVSAEGLARSEDEFVIQAPTPSLDGQTATASAKMLVTGRTVIKFSGSPPDGVSPTAGYGVSLDIANQTGTNLLFRPVFDTDTQDTSAFIYDPGTRQPVAGPIDEFTFRYGEPFTLRASLRVFANPDDQELVGGNETLTDFPQTVSSNFLSTAVLGFVLPEGATLSAIGSNADYAQATTLEDLDQVLSTLQSSPASVLRSLQSILPLLLD